jgi:hypothetical protein
MTPRSVLTAVAAAAAAVALVASPAAAQGQVERGPENANSLCSFSGLNDDPDAEFPEGGRTQSYGQLVRQGVIAPSQVKGGEPSPGTLCNGRKVPLKELSGEAP